MKNFSLKVLLIILIVGITGCSTPSTTVAPKVETKISKKFQFFKVNLSVTQLIDPDTKYHSENELELLLNKKLRSLLEENNLLSTHIDANFLMIDATYERRFVGDKTPIPSTSLSYPSFTYSIDVQSHTKSLIKIEKSKFPYKGNLTLTRQIIAKTLNVKTDEIQFIDALANSIFNDIKNLK